MTRKVMSAKQYAEHLGVDKKSVYHYIRSGLIKDAVVGRKGPGNAYQIDVERADELRSEGLNHSASRNRLGKNKLAPPPPGTTVSAEDEEELVTATVSNQRKAHWDAKLAEQKYRERAGQLVDKQDAKRQAFAFTRTLRDRILGVPDRIDAQLASETDQLECRKIVRDELLIALQTIETEALVA